MRSGAQKREGGATGGVQVVLLERVERLGQMGQIVKVKPGYARNYLIPQRKALRASKENLVHFEKQKAHLEATNLKLIEEAKYVAQKMDSVVVTIIRQASEAGHLYGSVRNKDIADCLVEQGFSVHKNQIQIPVPIKSLGLASVKVMLHPEVSVSVSANIAQSLEEAAVQLEKLKGHKAVAESEEATAE